MKVSIVTISFNQAKYIERTIRSVLQQSYDDIEYIVIDAGSTDGSREIIDSYRDRISRVIFEADAGPSDGLNKGFDLSTGEILGYLNSDDALLPGAVSEAVAAIINTESDVVCGNGLLVDGNGDVIRRIHSAPYSLWRAAYVQSIFVQQSTFFKRSAYLATSGFNVKNRVNWDAELMMDMVRAGASVKKCFNVWSIYTIHENSITGSARLVEAQKLEAARHFERIIGRKWRRRDQLLKQYARALRWILDPHSVFERIIDKLYLPKKRFRNFSNAN